MHVVLKKANSVRFEPVISGVSVVLVGDFAPAIFTPAWFALNGLLPKKVADSANLQIAHKQMTVFEADWLNIRVEPERFIAETLQSPNIRLCDFVLNVFKKHLDHTPLKAFGINRNIHFCVRFPDEREQIGRTLAPVKPWGDWASKIGFNSRQGGLLSLTMSPPKSDERLSDGRISVKVEPSSKVGDEILGVFVNVNNHYENDNTNSGETKPLLKLLEDNFESSIELSDGIIDHVMSLAKSQGNLNL